jgi:hypothetical protein
MFSSPEMRSTPDGKHQTVWTMGREKISADERKMFTGAILSKLVAWPKSFLDANTTHARRGNSWGVHPFYVNDYGDSSGVSVHFSHRIEFAFHLPLTLE